MARRAKRGRLGNAVPAAVAVPWRAIEPLEGRLLLAASMTISGDTAILNGDNQIRGTEVLRLDGQSGTTTAWFTANGSRVGSTFDIRFISNVVINGNAGNDDIAVNLTWYGLATTLRGGDGDDTLSGQAQRDHLDGGPGSDWASYRYRWSNGIVVNLSTGRATGAQDPTVDADTLVAIENVMGSDFADTLVGDSRDNRLMGRAGYDMLDGGAGADWASYEYRSEYSIYGVTVWLHDTNQTDPQRGRAFGRNDKGAGDGLDSDILWRIENAIGSDNADSLQGNAGPNHLIGLAGNDTLAGGLGDDTINGGYGADSLYGGGGADTVDYSFLETYGVTVTLTDRGGTSSEGDVLSLFSIVVGSRFADSLIGNDKPNTLMGGHGHDLLRGNGGDDRFEGGAGADWFDGGEGNDVVSYLAHTSGITLDLAAGVTPGGDRYADIEQIWGTNYDDQLTGGDGDEFLLGWNGKDILHGAGGNDTLSGGAGADQLFGDAGINTVDYGYRPNAGVFVNLETGAAGAGADADALHDIQNIRGSNFADTLIGDSGDNTIAGGGGNDRIAARGGADTVSYLYRSAPIAVVLDPVLFVVSAADETDTVEEVENLWGSNHNDTLTGTAGADVICGAGGSDLIYGLGGNDWLWGGGPGTLADGDLGDALFGGEGTDVLVGARGRDTLIGGDGWDAVLYGPAYENWRTVGIRAFADGQVHFTDGAEDLLGADIEQVNGTDFGDRLTGSDNPEWLDGAGGADTLCGLGGQDTLVGGDGWDAVAYNIEPRTAGIIAYLDGANHSADGAEDVIATDIEQLSGTGFDDLLVGGEGNDYLLGMDGKDTLSGMPGTDTLNGGDGDDLMLGGGGDDKLLANPGADRFDGGDGSDAVEYSGSAGAVINLADPLLDGDGDTFAAIESVYGTAYADTLTGATGDCALIGRGSNDTFTSGTEADNPLSRPWVEEEGAFTILNGRIIADVRTGIARNTEKAVDVIVTATVTVASGHSVSLLARYADADSCYRGEISSSYAFIRKGSEILVSGLLPGGPTAGGVLRFEVVGSSLKLYLDDVLVASAEDATLTEAGYAGIRSYVPSGSNTPVTFTNLSVEAAGEV